MDVHAAVDRFASDVSALETAIGARIVGQRPVVEGVVDALLAGGHVLLEGVPGLGKTALVRALAEALDLSFSRVQFTPDLMPADITGTNIIVEDAGGGRRFEFQPGPVFANILLADEINRATPKTQSALLEAMQDRSVTVGRHSHELAPPFFVLATQNPVELEGTYPLPEAQLDRFLFKLRVGAPSRQELHAILDRTTGAAAGGDDADPGSQPGAGAAAADPRGAGGPAGAGLRGPADRGDRTPRPRRSRRSASTCGSAARPGGRRRSCWRPRCGRCASAGSRPRSPTCGRWRPRRCATGCC